MPQKVQITKRELRKIAKIYTAVGVYHMLGCGGATPSMSEDEHKYFQDQVNREAGRIASRLPNHIFNLASLDDITKYVLNERTDRKT